MGGAALEGTARLGTFYSTYHWGEARIRDEVWRRFDPEKVATSCVKLIDSGGYKLISSQGDPYVFAMWGSIEEDGYSGMSVKIWAYDERYYDSYAEKGYKASYDRKLSELGSSQPFGSCRTMLIAWGDRTYVEIIRYGYDASMAPIEAELTRIMDIVESGDSMQIKDRSGAIA